MGQNNKNYCDIHHYYFSVKECPICEAERLEKYVKKFGVKTKDKTLKEEKEINDSDITKLMEKFNRRSQ